MQTLRIASTRAVPCPKKKFLCDLVKGGAVATDGQFIVRCDQTVYGKRTLTLGFEGLDITNQIS